MTKHMLLGHDPDLIAEWPTKGIMLDGLLWEVCRCTRCEEVSLGVHGEEHWRDRGLNGKMLTLRRCIGRDSKVGVLKRSPITN